MVIHLIHLNTRLLMS